MLETSGQFQNSEGNFPTARGNPSYQFSVDSIGIVVVEFDWDSNMVPASGYLELRDDIGNLIINTDSFYGEPVLGMELAIGQYVLVVEPSCCSLSEPFTLTFSGDVSAIGLDTDQDGELDVTDPDDDDDGVLDESDSSSLNWFIP